MRKRRRAESRTAQLEEKLEDLVSLLRNQGAVVNLPAAAGTTPVPTAAHGRPAPDPWVNTPAPSHGSQSDTPAAGISDARSDPNPGARAPMDPQTTADVSNSAFHPRLFNEPLPVPVPMASMMQYPWMPTPRQAEERLRLFCEQCLRCSPCIYIPPGTTSEKLRAEKPFSWFTIMMIACQTSSLQFAMGGAWQKIISQKIIIEHEKDIDLLQGMVIFLTWSVSAFRIAGVPPKPIPVRSPNGQVTLPQKGQALHGHIYSAGAFACLRPVPEQAAGRSLDVRLFQVRRCFHPISCPEIEDNGR